VNLGKICEFLAFLAVTKFNSMTQDTDLKARACRLHNFGCLPSCKLAVITKEKSYSNLCDISERSLSTMHKSV